MLLCDNGGAQKHFVVQNIMFTEDVVTLVLADGLIANLSASFDNVYILSHLL